MQMTRGQSTYSPGARGSGDWDQRHGSPSPASLRRSRVLGSMSSLPDSQNPYARFSDVSSTDDDVSIDDGINMDSSEASENDHDDDQIFRAMPDDEEVAREFEEFLEATSPVSDVEEKSMRAASIQDKWRLIYNQKARSPIFQVGVYIENLRQHTSQTKKRWSLGRRLSRESINSLTYWLRKLKLDLSMSAISFVKQFVNAPNDGVQLLVNVLNEVQSDQAGLSSAAKRAQKEDIKRGLTDENDTLLCIKFALRVEEGARRLIELNNGVETVAKCVNSTFTKCRIVALNLLSLVSHSEGGYTTVLETMTRRRMVLGETVRFKTLVAMVNNGASAYLPFLTACVNFFNTLLGLAESPNARVYLQHEMILAGFDPDLLDKYCYGSGFEFEDLERELESWRNSYIDVNSVSDHELEAKSRTTALRDEVDRLQFKLKEAEGTHRKKELDLKEQEEKCNEYRERAAKLQDTVEELRRAYQQQTGQEVMPDLHIDEVLKPLDIPEEDKYGTFRSSTSTLTSGAPEPPPIPKAPLPPPNYLSQTIRRKVVANVNLPMFHWTPLSTIKNTIFEEMDDETTLREMDFKQFEKLFQLRSNVETDETRKKRDRILGNKPKKISFVELNRAKNMAITKRKTGLTSRQIHDAIDKCEVDVLPGEYAELLIKYIPNKNELKELAHHATAYKDMGDAEQFLFQLAQVTRLESKLSVLALMGILDELLSSLKPQIESILQASNCVWSCESLKSVFEIILAFGNYMNSSKRGYALGFRIESLNKLTDIKSNDKSMTVLHFLEEYFNEHRPDLLAFYDELDFKVDKWASYQSILSDIVGLRKSLDLVKMEKEKQPENAAIREFHSHASNQIVEVAELFKKMEDVYRDVCVMYGENFRHTEPGVFFGTITNFAEAYKTAAMENWKKKNPGQPITKWLALPRPGVAVTANQVAMVRRDLEDELLYDDTVVPDYPGAPSPSKVSFSNVVRRESSRRRSGRNSRPKSKDPDDIIRTSGSNNWILKASSDKRVSVPTPEEDYYDDTMLVTKDVQEPDSKENNPNEDPYDSIPAYEDKAINAPAGPEEYYLDLDTEEAPAIPNRPRPRTNTMQVQDILTDLDAKLDDQDYMYMEATETQDTEL